MILAEAHQPENFYPELTQFFLADIRLLFLTVSYLLRNKFAGYDCHDKADG